MAGKPKRAKIRLEFAEKLFYERALTEWREKVVKDTGSKNHSFVLRNALCNLKLFPLDVNGFTDLRKIRGIGVDIATRLSSAWKFACEAHFGDGAPTVAQIKTLRKGEALAIVERSSTENAGGRLPFVGTKQRRPLILSQNGGTNGQKNKKNSAKFERAKDPLGRASSQECVVVHTLEDALELADYDHLLNVSVSQPALSFEFEGRQSSPKGPPNLPTLDTFGQLPPPTSSTSSLPSSFRPDGLDIVHVASPSSLNSESEPALLTHSAEQFAQSHLLLITDNREHCAGARTQRKAKGIGEHLATMSVSFESRPLSVLCFSFFDYLWVLQWTNWAGKRHELVLDYVVERKTLDDLKRSIKEPRYMEQKQRLRKCGLRNVLFVVEGGTTANDRALEQAMVSSGVESGFLVHRTPNVQGTAKFLQHLTRRLTERCAKQQVTGPPFDVFQEQCKKAHAVTVSDCWLRQLTVCPGISVDRAQMVRSRFPTFRSLVEFCRHNNSVDGTEPMMTTTTTTGGQLTAIGRELPQLSAAVCKNLQTFFRRAMAEA
uniref:Crossover junction endonuclease MUS81 n=1 Tax=Globodera rostochiensis TaxID=31243 RepID=A0A914HLG3_GLORO